MAKTTPAQRRTEVATFARTLVGIHETPAHSNDGPDVHRLQSSTGAYRAPWCVSTRQYIDLHAIGTTYADRTANVYYYTDYAIRHGNVIAKPVIGCAVCYRIGAGHMGTVVKVYPDGTFDAVEGNEADAVRVVRRDPRHIHCTFVLRHELAGQT